MKVSELQTYVGRAGSISIQGLTIAVWCLDAKVSYGGLRVLVEPTDEHSKGQAWVEEKKVMWTV